MQNSAVFLYGSFCFAPHFLVAADKDNGCL